MDLPVCISQRVQAVLAGRVCRRDVGYHTRSGVADEGILQDMGQFTLSERSVATLLVYGTDTLFQLKHERQKLAKSKGDMIDKKKAE